MSERARLLVLKEYTEDEKDEFMRRGYTLYPPLHAASARVIERLLVRVEELEGQIGEMCESNVYHERREYRARLDAMVAAMCPHPSFIKDFDMSPSYDWFAQQAQQALAAIDAHVAEKFK